MSIPLNNHYTESQLDGYYDAWKDYAQSKYGSAQGIQDAIATALADEGINTSDPLVSQVIENVRPLNAPPFDSNSTFNSFMREAYFGGLGGYLQANRNLAWAERTIWGLKSVSESTTSINGRIVDYLAQAEYVPTTVLEPTKVAALGRALGQAGVVLALASAVKEIYNAPDHQIETLKQASLLMAGVAAGSLTTAALLPLGFPVFAVGVGVIGGVAATYAVEKAWNEIPAMVQAAKAAGQSLMEATDAVADYAGQKLDDIYDATGALADQYLDEAAGLVDDLANGFGQLADDYGWALKNPDAVLGELPDWVPGVTGPFGFAELTGSPLVIDVDGDGIELAALGAPGSVYWDIDADGFREASGWIAGGASLAGVIAAHPAYLYS